MNNNRYIPSGPIQSEQIKKDSFYISYLKALEARQCISFRCLSNPFTSYRLLLYYYKLDAYNETSILRQIERIYQGLKSLVRIVYIDQSDNSSVQCDSRIILARINFFG